MDLVVTKFFVWMFAIALFIANALALNTDYLAPVFPNGNAIYDGACVELLAPDLVCSNTGTGSVHYVDAMMIDGSQSRSQKFTILIDNDKSFVLKDPDSNLYIQTYTDKKLRFTKYNGSALYVASVSADKSLNIKTYSHGHNLSVNCSTGYLEYDPNISTTLWFREC